VGTGVQARRRWNGRLAFLLLAGACLPGLPSGAQSVTHTAQDATLRELTAELARQSGYEFRLLIGRDADDVRRSVAWKDTSLAAAVGELAAAYRCDFLSVDSSGFFASPLEKATEREQKVGPYALQIPRLQTVDAEGRVALTLLFRAPDDRQMEAVAGLAEDLRILDNFGRPLVPAGLSGLRATSAIRVRLTEYRQQLLLTLPDSRATRIRSVDGTLVLYQKLTPLRFEFPLLAPDTSGTQAQNGLDVRLEETRVQGQTVSVRTRLAWAAGRNVVGRGISRTPNPYLVDTSGRVYRDASPQSDVDRDAQQVVLGQRCRFDGVQAPPARLVYDVWLREQPSETIPFHLTDIPLPAAGAEDLRRQRPFYAEKGGVLSLAVVDKQQRGVEGELSLGLSRKTAAGWSAYRWFDLLTDGQGRARLTHLAPGAYRVRRVFRLDPARPPTLSADRPVDVEVRSTGESAVPALQLPIAVAAPL